ncbi:MAG: hypothetical protein DRH26_02020 [Deltaproteobacteria bacterium]|nr:MAG: hypothetical protein DRH26_02020 [Deltaproteobacteria bacterium]
MGSPEISIFIAEEPVVGLLSLDNNPLIYAVENSGSPAIHLQETVGSLPFALPENNISIPKQNSQNSGGPGIVILPLDGGGRGPVINNGETITTGLLLQLLADSLAESEFTPALVNRLDTFTSAIEDLGIVDIATAEQLGILSQDISDNTDLINNNAMAVAGINTELLLQSETADKNQSGLATHGDEILLDFTWLDRLPLIDLAHSHGLTMQTVGADAGEITYITIPTQEIVYGHSGLLPGAAPDTYKFIVSAALLEYVSPEIIAVNWTSDLITAPAVTITPTSSVIYTTSDCMGFRIKGSMTLQNTGAVAVSGSMHVQISVDGAPWTDIASFYQRFDSSEVLLVEKHFDILLAYDQSDHSYQFRGELLSDIELTGGVVIDTVIESGSGSILSNDLQIKWAAKG